MIVTVALDDITVTQVREAYLGPHHPAVWCAPIEVPIGVVAFVTGLVAKPARTDQTKT